MNWVSENLGLEEGVSVIIPLYNAEETILAALQSVVRQRNCCSELFEIIIINDGSEDNSLQIVENFKKENTHYNVSIYSQINLGVSAARNVGIAASTKKYIAFLDADDEWLPDKTARQLSILEKNPFIKGIGSLYQERPLLWPYKITKPKENIAIVTFGKLLIRNEIQSSTLLISSATAKIMGGFEEASRYAEDHLFFLKMTHYFEGSLYILNENLIRYGHGKKPFGESGLSGNLPKMYKGFLFNLNYIKDQNWISNYENSILRLFYFLKYALLLIRTYIR